MFLLVARYMFQYEFVSRRLDGPRKLNLHV